MLSIIIPVYNSEKYLEECLESILRQSYTNYQVFLIDDGSTGGAASICDSYCLKYPFIKTIHKKNGGVSSARNSGLKLIGANTEYVCFVDSDDYLDHDFLEQLVSKAEDYDVVASGYRKVNNDRKVSYEQKTRDLEIRDRQEIKALYMSGEIKDFFYGPVAKLYKSSIVSVLCFDETLSMGEDIVFNIKFLAQASSVKIVDYTGYNYRYNSLSATGVASSKYTREYEHDNKYIRERIRNERIAWGIDEALLRQNDLSNSPMRYYNEITNLLRPGTPYAKKEIIRKIQAINNDAEFSCIGRMRILSLSNAEKISKLCWHIHNPYICYWLIKQILRWKREI